MVDLSFQPESLTPKPELPPPCQADFHCGRGINEEAWAALRIQISREAQLALFHTRVQGRDAHRGPAKKGHKINKPQNDISVVINLDDPGSVAHSEKSHSVVPRTPEMFLSMAPCLQIT